MTKWLTRAGALVAVAALSVSVAFAGPGKKAPKAAPKCPACKMDLTTKKDKTHTFATKVNGKTYYCCSDCPMAKAKTTKPAKGKKK